VGKTKLAKALARSIDCSVRRIQFTPDLLPSDVTGVSVYNQESRDFEFKPGAVFANLVVGDEINRASPKTQSALLECMEERQVTVDGVTYVLEAPFMVLATQNPIEMEGTYPLPEAQRDRFTARVSMGYPDPAAEMIMLADHAGTDPLDALKPVSTATEVRALIHAVRRVHVSDGVRRYAVDLVNATRRSADLRLGASPRAGLQLLRASKAQAALSGREYVLPDDLQRLAQPVLAHRMLLTAEAQIARRSADTIVTDLVRTVPVPRTVESPSAPSVGRRV
jgi:MoxR-like ATPase